ncbi:hypothetical protein BDA96_06G075100 [Sorghum bicolor]|uniref:Uncharacterized protein n=2 Tax=Sorghum bicolor TaxID=4558 RepID=A0A921UCD7_SORBI|nr:hypothetical protein BDA96_06G075100 [Sorghum bicolor]OQU81507.1 hypothetical protein SORBI_3006G067150 [Sorghum bicolor]
MMWGLASNDEFKECTWKNLYVTVVWDIKNTLFVRFGTRCMLPQCNREDIQMHAPKRSQATLPSEVQIQFLLAARQQHSVSAGCKTTTFSFCWLMVARQQHPQFHIIFIYCLACHIHLLHRTFVLSLDYKRLKNYTQKIG